MAVPVGVLLAIPAIRLTGLYLALATFGFGILLQGMFYTENYMFGLQRDRAEHADAVDRERRQVVLLPRPDPCRVRGDVHDLAGQIAARASAPRSVGVRDRARDERHRVEVTRVLVFCICAFMAAVGGALAGRQPGVISADATSRSCPSTYFTLIIIVLGGAPWDALLASAALFLIPSYISGAKVHTILQLLFGAIAILYAVTPARYLSLPEPAQQLIDNTFGRISFRAGLPARRAAIAAVPQRPRTLQRSCPPTLASTTSRSASAASSRSTGSRSRRPRAG